MKNLLTPKLMRIITLVLGFVIGATLTVVGIAQADGPAGNPPPSGSVPNPGTQQQELTNITFPAPYNVFEFVVTCGACHSGTVDQQAGHFGNWAGTAMASAARDPVFRANQQIVNATVLAATGKDGGGNICIRCHSPNAWYSGRTDPTLGGKGDASNMVHSILASTDDEGILCEACHRVTGGVTMKRDDLDPNDPVWNMMASIDDWPHAGNPYPDGPGDDMPYGDATLQINDGMAYTAKYPGYVEVTASDVPMAGTSYTGQTYGVYPNNFPAAGIPAPPAGEPATNPAGEYIFYGPDGSAPPHMEIPIGPPLDSSGNPDHQAQAVSLEHPTYGAARDGDGEGSFVTTPEFCGSCHDLTIPVLNHGMPEQRTYTEWKFSQFGQKGSATYTRCQDCHMPTQKHEYADGVPVSVNPDPALAGWFPYAKDRNPDGGTAFHKFDGSNRDLPQMMALLYPEVDLEVLGAPTGNDPRIFPGMLSSRDPMWTRAQRNNEISLDDAVSVNIVSGPAYNVAAGLWEVQVKVTNNTGHRIPTGYPDGRRFWISLAVTDHTGATVYESGFYDQAEAQLYTDSAKTGFERALSPMIDGSTSNAVMVYEKVTGTCVGSPATSCSASQSLLNNKILFNNSIPPQGFDYAQASQMGSKVYNYDPLTLVPYEETGRFGPSNGNNFDIVTYQFAAPSTAALTARAEVYWQTHTREFMEHLKDNNTSTYRPEGPPSVYAFNYPLTPNYLSDVIGLEDLTDLDGNPLRDNWGGIAYASWLLTNKGAPYLVGVADTAATSPPAAPTVTVSQPIDPAAGVPEPYTQLISWNAVPGADGYRVWIRYGENDATASWDKLALVLAPETQLLNTAINVGKTYAYKVEAFNGAGFGSMSAVEVATTGIGLPDAAPTGLQVVGSTSSSISLVWQDQSTNEAWFRIERQDVPVAGNFYWVADLPAPDPGGANAVNWTDTPLLAGKTYNYRVAACNNNGCSGFTLPVMGSTGGPPSAPVNLTGAAINGQLVQLLWQSGGGVANGYRIDRSIIGAAGPWTNGTFVVTDPNLTSYDDNTVLPNATYWYRVFAYNFVGDSPASNVISVTTPATPPQPPTLLTATLTGLWDPQNGQIGAITLNWTDNANNEDSFEVERAAGAGPGLAWTQLAVVPTNTTTYVDSTAQAGSTYSYRVRAVNTGGPSSYTNEVTVVTPGEPPAAPSELREIRVGKNQVTIGWRDNATNEEGYEVWRSLDGVTFTKIADLRVNSSSYKDKGVISNTQYWYRVRAYNNQMTQFSEWSETIQVRTR